jgi:hypothetical protein
MITPQLDPNTSPGLCLRIDADHFAAYQYPYRQY